MSIFSKIMETVVQFVPDKKVDPLIQKKTGYVGQPESRVDGKLKVTGAATFTAEYKLDNLTHAALVYSTIAKGKITDINTAAALQVEGVLAIVTHKNAPKLNKPMKFSPGGTGKGSASSELPIFQDATIHWDGQPIAIVVAETGEVAEYAATLVQVEYKMEKAAISFDALKADARTPSNVLNEPNEVKKGGAEKALAAADYKVDCSYHTPRYNHNAIEPHASIAFWKDDDSLVIFEASQGMYGVKRTLADLFSIKPDKVEVVSPFVGGGFGGKGSIWNNTMLCVLAAKVAGRPVKLAISREGVFRVVGGRTVSEQRVAIGANEVGKFVSIIHSGITVTTPHNDFAEQFTFPVRHLYASDNFLIGQKVVDLNTVANTFMRAPGESIGTFALESAIDELAHSMKRDPIELRLINEPAKDPTKETEFSSRNLIKAYRRGAEKFRWHHQPPRSQQDGKWWVGQGVATAYYPVYRFPASARVAIYADGTATVKAAAHEMGMGTATAQLQHAADRLGLSIEAVSFHYGDTSVPEASMAGGSNQTISVVAGVSAAVEKAITELLDMAGKSNESPLAKLKYEAVEMRDGGIWSKAEPTKGETYATILKRAGESFVEVTASSTAPVEIMKYSMGSYGAQFAEVRVNEDTGEVRVSRWVASFDTGRIINPKTATSQFKGGIIMGIGMALTEETFFDERRGRIMNPSLAEYHVPVHLDVPPIEVIYNNIPDEHTPLGAHGIGEIGITGVAAAIANAVFNAIGVRVRDLPITLDKVLEGME